MKSELEILLGNGPVHFIGIGGISMSGLAQILLHRGIKVTGSDLHDSPVIKQLRNLHADITIPHNAECISNQSLVIYTAAIPQDNPEMIEADRKNIKKVERGFFLGLLASAYTNTLAISGTHGKTTTTGMLSSVLLEAKRNPTIHIGGMLPLIGGNTRLGGSEWFVMEACEYKNSFLHFYPNGELILNIDEDHLDFFTNLDHIIASFHNFTQNVKPGGKLVLNMDNIGCRKLVEILEVPYIGYSCSSENTDKNAILEVSTQRSAVNITSSTAAECSTDNMHESVSSTVASECSAEEINERITPNASALYSADNLTEKNGCYSFTVKYEGNELAKLTLQVPGMHNVSNAVGCFALCHQYGLAPETVAAGISNFTGTGRRFERKGTLNGILIIDDYAHHPTEIQATLSAAVKTVEGKVICVFQPHLYSRTSDLLINFAATLCKADETIIIDIYAAREPDLGVINSKDLVREIQKAGGHSQYSESFQAAADTAMSIASPGDLILTMGAGDVDQVAELLVHSS